MQPFRAKRKIRATLHIFVGKLEAVSEHLQSLLFSVRESRSQANLVEKQK
jgi:hypothetical protein